MRFQILVALILLAIAPSLASAERPLRYDIGSPSFTDLWVDPARGSDDNSGRAESAPFRSVTRAWREIPSATPLTGAGYRIHLRAGEYSAAHLPQYWEGKRGSFEAPILLQSYDGPRQAVFRHGPNVYGVSHAYFIGIRIAADGDAFHCEQCDHVLLRDNELDGGNRVAWETFKANQSSHIYLEGNDIHGAGDNAVDFVGVQHGHVAYNRIHDAGDWCIYFKGGSSYFRAEGNEIFNCDTGGLTAGQGSGFEFNVIPWIHYEAYDIRAVNNVIHDTVGAGLGVNGGFNILFAYNTLYRIGSRSHSLEVVWGYRSCDGNRAECARRLEAGGWGTMSQDGPEVAIPNRNVYLLNNVLYNPPGARSPYQHFAIYGERSSAPGSNLPPRIATDANLVIAGNLLWNGPVDLPLGIEGDDQGCRPSNPTCNASQLVAENRINGVEPTFLDADGGDLRPRSGSSLLAVRSAPLPSFPGGDRPTSPLSPAGPLTTNVEFDRGGAPRAPGGPPGAYVSDSSPILPPDDSGSGDPARPVPTPRADPTVTPPPVSADPLPVIHESRCAPRSVKRRKSITCRVRATDNLRIVSVKMRLGSLGLYAMKLVRGRYETTVKPKKIGRYVPQFLVTDSSGGVAEAWGREVRVQR